MYERIETKLQKEFDSVAPDLLMQVKNAEITKIHSEEELFREWNASNGTGSKSRLFPRGFKALCTAAAVVICVLSVFYYTYSCVPAGTVSVRTETGYRLTINRRNQIIAVEVLDSGSSDKVIPKEELKGKGLGEALDTIFDSVSEKNKDIVNKKKSHTPIVVEYEGTSNQEAAKKIIADTAEQYSREKNMEIKANCQSSSQAEESMEIPEAPAIQDRIDDLLSEFSEISGSAESAELPELSGNPELPDNPESSENPELPDNPEFPVNPELSGDSGIPKEEKPSISLPSATEASPKEKETTEVPAESGGEDIKAEQHATTRPVEMESSSDTENCCVTGNHAGPEESTVAEEHIKESDVPVQKDDEPVDEPESSQESDR